MSERSELVNKLAQNAKEYIKGQTPEGREAIRLIAYLRSANAVPRLVLRLAEEQDSEVRRTLVGALSCSNDVQAVSALCSALQDPDWQVREQAGVSLGKILSPLSIGALMDALADPAWEVRLKAANTLGQLTAREAVAPLAPNLRHPISNLRKEVANALGAIGEASSRAALESALDDPDVEVRKAVQRALERLQ